MIITPWLQFIVALGIGLLIGLERERSKGDGPYRRPAGIRTFALAAVLGALAVHLGGALLLAIAIGGVAILTAISYRIRKESDPGLTTEIGLIATPLLGALAMTDALLASGLAATVAAIFAAKVPLHGFVKGVLTEAEVKEGLILAVATLLIWPQLPDRAFGPMGALNPYNIWMLVILVLAVGACGHIATRVLGPRFGLPLSGLASGFVSSTATIGAMAGRVAKDASCMDAAVAGAAFSTVATFVQVALLLGAISTPVLAIMAPGLAAGTIVVAGYGFFFAQRAFVAKDAPPASDPGGAFSLVTALAFAAIMAVMLILTAVLNDWLGEAGIIVGAAVGGMVDAHSATISIAALVASAKLAPQDAVLPILAAMTSNTLAKILMARGAGSAAFARRIVPALVLSMVLAWAVMMVIKFW